MCRPRGTTCSRVKSNYFDILFPISFKMETVIKQAEESKRGALESARRVVEDYRPLKHEVDLMRTELLGLEKLPDLPNDDKERLSSLG